MAKKPRGAARSEAEPESKSQRTRQRILDAAAHVLSVKGFAGTRLNDVAQYAELQAPAIYYYFPSRESLIEEVMYCGISEMRQYLQETLDALPDGTAPLDRILVAVEAHLRHELELSDYATASIRNSGQIPEHLRTRERKESAAYSRMWQRLFDDAATEGEIRDDLDPRIVQGLVLGALNWAAEWWDPKRGTLDTMVTSAQALVRSGIAATPTKPARRKRSTPPTA
ncbi:putative transcriptional regulator, TetR family protein [Mycolicibacterium anyangense]|uniref:Putative transcriptional regulator, TetR family protein n=1 Tax=Mycolicibacterium anyangense TaxID=1431246 RepID=A0A6N4VYZ1_9MYCO|nr:TetR/AcrR family transcriptional regulator [Mycolicibacterium anyangense]BBZ74896.1 putative transcriptional regulator, TetR family protein [Mycolicibacterium anyangense]